MSRRKPQLSLASPSEMLQVMDMGLDFRSYISRVDENGLPILGNVISYPASKVADTFEPTVGLLVTLLHLCMHNQGNPASASIWLKTYDTVQKVFIDQSENDSAETKQAQEARQAVARYFEGGQGGDVRGLIERLLYLLDHQSGIRGAQAPSQRKIPRDPKGAFCNLHLADHKCYQEFACNQLHLHEAGPVRHRMSFFQRLAETLMKEKRPRNEVLNRVKDSIFFARYGNKVTVRCLGNWIPFFKTVYTDGRLEQAFRYQSFTCSDHNCSNEHCKGVHPQDRRTMQPIKQLDLHNQQQVTTELDEEAEHIVSTLETQPDGGVPPMQLSQVVAVSPNTEAWRTTVRDYVRQSGIPQVEADEALLKTLQDTRVTGTPLSSMSGRMTPLLEEIDLLAFNSSVSSMNSNAINEP